MPEIGFAGALLLMSPATLLTVILSWNSGRRLAEKFFYQMRPTTADIWFDSCRVQILSRSILILDVVFATLFGILLSLNFSIVYLMTVAIGNVVFALSGFKRLRSMLPPESQS